MRWIMGWVSLSTWQETILTCPKLPLYLDWIFHIALSSKNPLLFYIFCTWPTFSNNSHCIAHLLLFFSYFTAWSVSWWRSSKQSEESYLLHFKPFYFLCKKSRFWTQIFHPNVTCQSQHVHTEPSDYCNGNCQKTNTSVCSGNTIQKKSNLVCVWIRK
jgi:hypothetical protein